MFIVYFLLLILPTKGVLADESPPISYVCNISLPVPPSGGDGSYDIVTYLLIQLTQDMKEVKQDVSQVKNDVSQVKLDVDQVKLDVRQVQLNQTVLQEQQQQDMESIKYVLAVGRNTLEGKYKRLNFILCIMYVV